MVDQPDWDLRLGYLIHDVSRLRRMMFDRDLAPLGITRSQWWVLAFISRKDGSPQTQLANELDVGKVAVGALIDRLESFGFVIRQADPVDRRVKRVYVTKQARGFLEKLRKETDKFNAKIVNGIDRKQLENASDALLAMPARHVGRHAVRESKRGRRRGGATHQDPEATTGSLRASSPAPSSAVPFCAVHILKTP
jgi:MarR family transcriptional regulator, transcriptional regulator for hemolysin